MSDIILKTKITAPPLRPGHVHRGRLRKILDHGLLAGCNLTLVSAAAGAGKTTLIACWLRDAQSPAAWLSLDEEDNEFHRFWTGLITALQTVKPEIGAAALAALRTSAEIQPKALAVSVLNDLAAADIPIVTVLDDYHLIRSEAVHDSVNFFLANLPPRAHLVVSTRQDPPLALSRYRAAMRLTEIRTPDLRFSPEEAKQLLREGLGVELPAADLTALEKRTEGWAAGLQMAALSLKGMSPADRTKFIGGFSGDDRYVMDYLAEDVLHKQPRHIQSFLLKTAILERMCAALCDHLTGRTDSRWILERLEAANLFTVPLDNRRIWYRYHHLFADLLRRTLAQGGEVEFSGLYRRASQWYEREGLIAEAVSHALAAKDYEYTAELIERNILDTFYRSETRLVEGWLRALPEEILRSRPLLAAVNAGCLMLAHMCNIRSPETRNLVETWLRQTEILLDKTMTGSGYAERTAHLARHYVNKIRVYLAHAAGDDLRAVLAMTESALARLPRDERMFRSALLHKLGHVHFDLGDEAAAIKAFEQAVRLGEASGDLYNLSSSIAWLARLTNERGDSDGAMAMCREGLEVIDRLAGGGSVPYAGGIHLTLGGILAEQCRFDAAMEEIGAGLKLLDLTNAEPIQDAGRIEMAYIRQALGQTETALAWLTLTKRSHNHPPEVIAAHQARICLLAADRDPRYEDRVRTWAEARTTRFDTSGADYAIVGLTMVRAAAEKIAGPAGPAPLEYLDRQLAAAERANRPRRQIEVLLLQARLHHLSNKTNEAMESMGKALRLGKSHGYLRVFIDEGRPIADLLRLAAARRMLPDYVSKVLAVFDRLEKEYPATEQPAMPMESLSPREFEVLQLMAAGATNPEIAARLFISISTVKTHVGRVFGKLGVQTRTQAIVRARDLRLVE